MVATWWTIKNLKYKFEEKNVSVQVAMVKLLGTWWTGQQVPWSSRFSIVLHLLGFSGFQLWFRFSVLVGLFWYHVILVII